jgi:hypothetical protein
LSGSEIRGRLGRQDTPNFSPLNPDCARLLGIR